MESMNSISASFGKLIRSLLTHKFVHNINFPVVRLGSLYGGWNVAILPELNNKTALCCGAGEDISFDLDLASKYRLKVIIVDPTPRAISHVGNVISRIGYSATSIIHANGNQTYTSYDLANLKNNQLVLIPKALWDKNENVRFYAPCNPCHVSHSIINFQNNYSKMGDYIEVEAVDMQTLMSQIGLSEAPEIIKLDIEGAEHEVLANLLNNTILPRQILVEYDELSRITFRSLRRFNATHKLLKKYGYKLFAVEHLNYSYLRS